VGAGGEHPAPASRQRPLPRHAPLHGVRGFTRPASRR
jgi:hypothetical protein